ncbi:MAG: hypothetical protein HKN78_02150 [Sphingomonadaceae bacterium]|nr:hypothetical protein [Sphingomonadaceae bacterium]
MGRLTATGKYRPSALTITLTALALVLAGPIAARPQSPELSINPAGGQLLSAFASIAPSVMPAGEAAAE